MPREPFGHGTAAKYKKGCRCPKCSMAYAVLQKESKRRREARMRSGYKGFKHGLNGYLNWGCRCNVCVAGNKLYCQRLRD